VAARIEVDPEGGIPEVLVRVEERVLGKTSVHVDAEGASVPMTASGAFGVTLYVADFYSGLDGWGAAFRDRGHRVVSFDLDPRFKPNVVVDMNNVLAVNGFDVILASPPCERFTIMRVSANWRKDHSTGRFWPKNAETEAAVALARHTFAIVKAAQPRYYVIENPRAMMCRVIESVPVTTTYCRWGMPYMKPTHLWTNIVGDWPKCKAGTRDHHPQPRTHADRKRMGVEKLGVQGISDYDGTSSPAQRALIPYRLSLAVCLAAERDGTLPAMEEVIAVEAERRMA